MKLWKVLKVALSIGVLLWLAVGCVGIQSDPNSDLPSTVPANWEGQTLGVPM